VNDGKDQPLQRQNGGSCKQRRQRTGRHIALQIAAGAGEIDAAELKQVVAPGVIEFAGAERIILLVAMRRRIGKLTEGEVPVSTTRTKPQRVSIASSAAASFSGSAVAASAHTGSVKWTWEFQKPAVTVAPAQSMTVAPAGIPTRSGCGTLR